MKLYARNNEKLEGLLKIVKSFSDDTWRPRKDYYQRNIILDVDTAIRGLNPEGIWV